MYREKCMIMHNLKNGGKEWGQERPDHGSPVQMRKTNQCLDLRDSFALSSGYFPPKNYCPGIYDIILLLSFINLLPLDISLIPCVLCTEVLSFMWTTSHCTLLLWLLLCMSFVSMASPLQMTVEILTGGRHHSPSRGPEITSPLNSQTRKFTDYNRNLRNMEGKGNLTPLKDHNSLMTKPKNTEKR